MERTRPDRYDASDDARKNLQAATIEDAKFYIDMAFRKKAFANDIEMEQIRRRINDDEEE